MKFSGKIIGSKQVLKAVEDIFPNYKRQYAKNLTDSTLEVHRQALKLVQKTSVGKTVTRYRPKRMHIVSKPGDPPNTDRGTLVKSIQFDIDTERLRSQVGTNLKYGKDLEYGTSKMEARPWLFPALLQAKARILEFMVRPPKGGT